MFKHAWIWTFVKAYGTPRFLTLSAGMVFPTATSETGDIVCIRNIVTEVVVLTTVSLKIANQKMLWQDLNVWKP